MKELTWVTFRAPAPCATLCAISHGCPRQVYTRSETMNRTGEDCGVKTGHAVRKQKGRNMSTITKIIIKVDPSTLMAALASLTYGPTNIKWFSKWLHND